MKRKVRPGNALRVMAHKVWPCPLPPPWAAVWPLACGHKGCSVVTDMSEHSYYCVHLVARGRVRFRTVEPDTDVCLGPGDVFLQRPFTWFAYRDEDRADGGEQTRVWWAHLGGHLVREYTVAMGFAESRVWFRAAEPETLERLFAALLALTEDDTEAADVRAVLLLHQMLPACGYQRRDWPRMGPLARQVREFMASEAHRGLNIDQISDAFHVSRSSLFLHFKREFGKSPIQVQQDIRLEKARALLERSDLPIREVARVAGYADPLYFSRKFRQRFGMPPGAYRGRTGAGTRGA